jgi:hypothetical protein
MFLIRQWTNVYFFSTLYYAVRSASQHGDKNIRKVLYKRYEKTSANTTEIWNDFGFDYGSIIRNPYDPLDKSTNHASSLVMTALEHAVQIGINDPILFTLEGQKRVYYILILNFKVAAPVERSL